MTMATFNGNARIATPLVLDQGVVVRRMPAACLVLLIPVRRPQQLNLLRKP